MTRIFRLISGAVCDRAPHRAPTADSIVRGATRALIIGGRLDNPGYLHFIRRNAAEALAGDWAAIGGDMDRAIDLAADNSGVSRAAALAAADVADHRAD